MQHPVEESLEIAAETGIDLAPLVYTRLFAQAPQVEPMFSLDTEGAVRGSMLSHALRAILDLVGERHFGPSLISAEAMAHANYDVDPAVFAAFFPIIRDVVRDIAGAAWSPDMEAAWEALIGETSRLVKGPNAPSLAP